MTRYYRIIDLQLIAKDEDFVPFVYDVEKKAWIRDNNNILMDRIIGYEPGEGIGNTSAMEDVEEISKEKAFQLIKA